MQIMPRHRGLGGKYSISIYLDEEVEGSNLGEGKKKGELLLRITNYELRVTNSTNFQSQHRNELSKNCQVEAGSHRIERRR